MPGTYATRPGSATTAPPRTATRGRNRAVNEDRVLTVPDELPFHLVVRRRHGGPGDQAGHPSRCCHDVRSRAPGRRRAVRELPAVRRLATGHDPSREVPSSVGGATVRFTIEPRLLDHFGIAMYSTIPKAIAELCANS